MLTRRDTARLLLAGAALPALPGFALAQESERWARRFQAELRDHMVAGCDGDLKLVQFGMGGSGGRVIMAAVVELRWSPGLRRRRFDARGTEDEATYRQLMNLALFEYATAWPGCVV